MISDLLIRHLRWRWHPLFLSERLILSVSNSNSLQKSSAIQKSSVILSLVIIVMFVVIDWFSTIKLQKYNEITNFLQTFLIPSSGYYPLSQASCPPVNLSNSSTNTLINLQILSNVCRIGKNWKGLERLMTWHIIQNSQLFERSSHQYVIIMITILIHNSQFIIHNYDYRYSDSSKLKG